MLDLMRYHCLVFQSTLPRRERRRLCRKSRRGNQNFNPRSREGSDRWIIFDYPRALWISIHAPAKGATDGTEFDWVYKQDFNPRSREGSDKSKHFLQGKITKFQSTLPRRERPCLQYPYCTYTPISIHAPAKGATLATIGANAENPISIHAPAKGATFS